MAVTGPGGWFRRSAPDRIWAAKPDGSSELNRLTSASIIRLKLKRALARWLQNES
jgi:hypothetical protein